MPHKPLLWKGLAVGLLGLLLLLPLALVQGLIAERAGLKREVVRSVAQSAADVQRIALPVIVAPYTRTWIETTERTDDNGARKTTRAERSESATLPFLPESLEVSARPELDFKYRGLYRVLTYEAPLRISGKFQLPAYVSSAPAEGRVIWGTPVLAVGVGDPRGIKNSPVLTWNGASIPFEPGATEHSRLGNGISARLASIDGKSPVMAEFSLVLVLSGMERLSFIPTGRETHVDLDAAWGHPSFFGKFSPAAQINASDFSARWKTSFYSTNAREAYLECVAGAKCARFEGNEFGVAFITPFDLYQQLERAAKYGLLFVGLTFAAFFLFEMLGSLSVHPVQYGLVGLALALFFVLLVSLSEHIGFAPAYGVAAGACVGLITVYSSVVLGSRARAAGLGAGLALLYGVLFMLLRSEDYALLMGSVFLFALLAALMLGTRRVDWYALAPGRRRPTMLKD